MRSHLSIRVAAVVAVCSLSVVSCSSDSKTAQPSTAGTSAATTAQSAAPDTTPTPADTTPPPAETTPVTDKATEVTTAALSGDPVLLGFLNSEKGTGPVFPDMGVGADVAVSVINANGGIGGRPLQLEKCLTDGTPAASQTCANQMIEKGVAAVATGIDFGGEASAPILTAAGIP